MRDAVGDGKTEPKALSAGVVAAAEFLEDHLLVGRLDPRAGVVYLDAHFTCHPAHVQGHDCAAILPHRSHYTTTVELIAPVRLRDALPCDDGSRLEVTVDLKAPAETVAHAAAPRATA